jgi:hypothetical protein
VTAVASVSNDREPQTDSISLVELKNLARRLLPRDSMLLSLIMAEPDNLPRIVALAKIEIFNRLLHQEAK